MSWSLNPANRVALWVCGGVMLALLAAVAVLAYQVSDLSERAGTLTSERDTARDERDEARAETALDIHYTPPGLGDSEHPADRVQLRRNQDESKSGGGDTGSV